MPTIRQELRPAMTDLTAVRVQGRHRRGQAAGCRDPQQWTPTAGEHDDARLVPGPAIATLATAAGHYIADGLWRPAGNRDLFQLLVREEGDEQPIRRPE